jgi:uncharacterized protein
VSEAVQEDSSPVQRFALKVLYAPDRRVRAIWRFVLGLLVVIFANIGAGFLASGAGYGRRFELAFRPLALVFAIAGFVLLAKVADEVEGKPFAYLGLGRRSWGRDFGFGAVLGLGMISVAVAVIAVAGDLTVNATITRRTLELAVVEVMILAAGALMEEVMFRGYPFQRLVESMGPWPAMFVVSGLFGAAHLTNPYASFWGVANTAAVGVLFCLAYLRTQSLWMPFGIHFAWNTALGLLFGLPVSGLRSFSVIVRSSAEGPLWLTGGGYGIEASALGTAVIVLGVVAVTILVKQRPKDSAANVCTGGTNAFETPDENQPERIQL